MLLLPLLFLCLSLLVLSLLCLSHLFLCLYLSLWAQWLLPGTGDRETVGDDGDGGDRVNADVGDRVMLANDDLVMLVDNRGTLM